MLLATIDQTINRPPDLLVDQNKGENRRTGAHNYQILSCPSEEGRKNVLKFKRQQSISCFRNPS